MKVQVDLTAKIPDYVEIEVVNGNIKESMVEQIKIQYDFLLKYSMNCKHQGHNETQCRILHPELRLQRQEEEKGEGLVTKDSTKYPNSDQGKFVENMKI